MYGQIEIYRSLNKFSFKSGIYLERFKEKNVQDVTIEISDGKKTFDGLY
jgi:hypothetical protein